MPSKQSSRSVKNYEHAGTWECESCGEEFEVETKLDPLSHALTCGATTDRKGGYDGYRRRQRELQRASLRGGAQS